MKIAPRGTPLLALAIAAYGIVAQPGSAAGPVAAAEGVDTRDYATVGRVVARFVDGRTVVVVPVAGTLRPRLSEPIRAGKRWRLDLVIEDAKLSSGVPVRRPEGVVALTVREVGSDVRVSVEVDVLGDYGVRRSEEGMLLWIDAGRKAPSVNGPTTVPVAGSAVMPGSAGRGQEAPVAPPGTNWVGMIALAIAAAVAGAAVRYVRRNGWPGWATDLRENAVPRIRELLVGAQSSGAAGPDTAGAVDGGESHRVPFGTPPADPRGRSAEIGDAFRVQPEKPASGIAALVAANENYNENDAE
ncbi:MAG TPA: hypothetical protein VMM79_13390 [Longimicrobiales bacterium]|nr:hypothetical protein [Longimicrobiales bacterium]